MSELINHFISDVSLEKEFLTNLKSRKLEQKFIYLGQGAKNYYLAYGDAVDKKNIEVGGLNASKLQYYNFFEKSVKKVPEIAFVSLGCGNCLQEKSLLEKLVNNGYDISYFGIDSSSNMLRLGVENMKELKKLPKQFICADFTMDDFKEEIVQKTANFRSRVFVFLGNTFLQPNQTYIIGTLASMLKKGDFLWVDALGRSENDDKDSNREKKEKEMQVFNRYSEYISNDKIMIFQFSPLKAIGIPFENGRMILETSEEKSVGAINFTYSFLFTKKTVISFRKETICFLPDEKIDLYTIRNYNATSFINFFHENGFKIIRREVGKIKPWLYENQFLFEKV